MRGEKSSDLHGNIPAEMSCGWIISTEEDKGPSLAVKGKYLLQPNSVLIEITVLHCTTTCHADKDWNAIISCKYFIQISKAVIQ